MNTTSGSGQIRSDPPTLALCRIGYGATAETIIFHFHRLREINLIAKSGDNVLISCPHAM